MYCLYLLLCFLPFTFGGVLEPSALLMKGYDYLEPMALPVKGYDLLEPNALPMKTYDFLEPSGLPMERYNVLSNISMSDIDWDIEEKSTLVCTLVCFHKKMAKMDLWICKWRKAQDPCHNVTQEIMKNAETIYPEMPYLINASSSPTFGLLFIETLIRVSSFEDGFLSDYPNLYGFIAAGFPIKKISKNMFEGVRREIHWLDIQHSHSLSEIEPGAFRDMTSLEYLSLRHLNLSIMENNTFKDLASLTYLSLGNNIISRIERNMFVGLDSCLFLELAGNFISKIEAHTFTHLHSLEQLNLPKNFISYIHKDAFTGFKGFMLVLDWNRITSSDLDSIRNLTGIVTLYLTGNHIRSVSSDIFKNLPLLYRVYLEYNPLSSLPTGIFNHSKNLHEIVVGCGQHKYPQYFTNLTLESGSFVTKSRLDQVLINGCLTEIKPSAFRGLRTKRLALQYNSIKKIKRSFFEGIIDLSRLSLGGNGIEIVEVDSFYDPLFKDLNFLSLHDNRIKTIAPHTFHHLTELKFLCLFNNLITVITQNDFERLHYLLGLSLEFNSISKIEENAFSSVNDLVLLNVSHNCIHSLSDVSFEGLEELLFLDISYNKIDKISSSDLEYFATKGLRKLFLQGNNIMKIEPMEFTLRLQLLDLSKNHLTNMEIFTSIDIQIDRIILSKNKITSIDQEIQRTKVKELILDHNKISEVDNINSIYTLNLLDLRYNEIKELRIEEIDALQEIGTFYLDGNPWKCSCSQSDRPLMDFLLKLGIISCCPTDCICEKTVQKLVEFSCHSKNKSSLPICLPFEQVKLDYSKNSLTDLTLTSFHENITHLDLNQNLLTNINGPSFTHLKNLSYLDLRSNNLKNVPHQFEHLKATKIYLEKNDFLCNDCELIRILETVNQVTPQNLSCKDNQIFQEASFVCLLEFTIAPYATLSIGIIALISGLYLSFNMLHMKRLSKRYDHKCVLLHLKKNAQAYKRECGILRDLDHQNIRKMYKNVTTWIPKRVGHLYFEKIDCSLRDALQDTALGSSLNIPKMMRQLMASIQFLHSTDNCIFIRNLSVDSILLQMDATNSWILKLGDFSQAIVHAPTHNTDEEAPLISSSDQGVILMQEDLQAAAHIVYFMSTRQEKEDPITMQDLKDESDIEISTLILSLQNGMSAADALLTAPFQLTEQRVSILGELNAFFKGLKKTKKTDKLRKAEENGCLVIGGKGAWNKYFDLALLEEFALLFDGYDITSYLCLLRIIRNIFQHGHESPSAMLAVFETETPPPQQLLHQFSEWFPFFYLHSIYCCYKFLGERNLSGSDIYAMTYQQFESYVCQYGVSTGSIFPLQDKSSISVYYKAPCEELQETIFVKGTRSCVYLKDVLPQIYEKSQNLWPDVPAKELFFKHRGKIILNPGSTDLSEPIDATNKLCIPEGSSLQVLKPEVKIQLPEQVVVKSFKKTDNVKSVKGYSIQFLPPSMRTKEKLKSILVTFDGKQLKDSQRILDLHFADCAFMVEMPR